MDVELETIEGPDAGMRRTLRGPGEFLAGRTTARSHPDIPLHSRDMLASRSHFVLAIGLTECRVRDAGSANGTWLVGRRGEKRIRGERVVADGSFLRAGGTLLRVTLLRPGAASPHVPRVAVPVSCMTCGAALTDTCTRDEVDLAAECGHLCDTCARAAAGNGSSREIGQYLVLSLLGKGTMGAAWRVWEAGTRRVLCLKECHSAGQASARAALLFLREIEVMKSLCHPNIVRFLGYGREGENHWFVSELQRGGNVEGLCASFGGRLPAAEAGRIIDGALCGLERMHDAGFVHRDVKPSNILLSRRDGGIPRLGDFGLAKRFSTAGLSGVTLPGDVAGTAGFMAPEQGADFRAATPRADIYAMGATFYRLLSGRVPRNPVTGVLVPLRVQCPELYMRLAAVVEKALADRPRDRWEGVRSFRVALREALQEAVQA